MYLHGRIHLGLLPRQTPFPGWSSGAPRTPDWVGRTERAGLRVEEVRKKAWWVRKKEENTLLSPMLRASICQHPPWPRVPALSLGPRYW